MSRPLRFQKEFSDLFRFWESLSSEQKNSLENQLAKIDTNTLARQRELLQPQSSKGKQGYLPFQDYAFSGDPVTRFEGEKLIEQGRLGCLLIAGGQGTRLDCQGPKGCYPLSLIQNKSLFQLFAERVRSAGKWFHRKLQVAIMTSCDNDKETRLYFQENQFFGLDPSQISFFVQGSLPLLDGNGKLFLQSPWEIATGPDGNGHSLLHFAASGILKKWQEQGIEYLHVVPVDNPLADPFDAELLGFHLKKASEITLKCTEKLHGQEKVGLLVKQQNRCAVLEYSEMEDADKEARESNGRLKYRCANLSLFCFSLSFIERLVHSHQMLPLHRAWKKVPLVDEKGTVTLSREPAGWKFETFIFDWLAHTEKVAALLFPRSACFSPLKNASGSDSPETVRRDLQQRDRRIIEAITGLKAPDFPFELAAEFHYPTPELITKWKGRQIAASYVEP